MNRLLLLIPDYNKIGNLDYNLHKIGLYLLSRAVIGLFDDIQKDIVWITTIVEYLSYSMLVFALAFVIPWMFVKIEMKFLS